MTSTNIGVIQKFIQKIKIDYKSILIIILILLIISGYNYHISKINKLKADKGISDKLNAALTDTLRVYVSKNNTLKYEKLAMQADINQLKNSNITLSKEKQILLNKVEKINKDKIVLTATIIKQKFVIDSLTNIIKSDGGWFDSTTVLFKKENNDTINYTIRIVNVAPVDNETPRMLIDWLEIPNDITVAFHWDKDKRRNYPVSVSVENSNPLMKVNNIEAYAIPELQKEDVKPTLWQKVKSGIKKFKDDIIVFGLGFLAGAGFATAGN